jgi:hypothetical protein
MTKPTPTPTAQEPNASQAVDVEPSGSTDPSPTSTAALVSPGDGGSAGYGGGVTGPSHSDRPSGQGSRSSQADPQTDRFGLGPSEQDARLDASLASSTLGLGGLVWTIPGLVLTMPGLLLLLAIFAQIGGAAAWLPVVKRKLGGFGFRSRRKI